MGRKKFEDRPMRGPGRKARKQGLPEMPKVLKKIDGKLKGRGGSMNKKKMKLKQRVAAGDDKIDNKPNEKKQSDEIEAMVDDNDANQVDSDSSFNEIGDDSFGSGDAASLDDEQQLPNGKRCDGAMQLDLGSDDDDEDEHFAEFDEIEEESVDEAEEEEEKEEDSEDEDIDINIKEDGEDASLSVEDLQQRIKETLEIMGDFKNKVSSTTGMVRKDYRARLEKDLASYYNYNAFLMAKLIEIFPDEILEFLDSNEIERPVTIRTNTLKTRRKDLAQALSNRGVSLEALGKWTKVGLVVYNSQIPIGATPEYLAGHYMLQGGASLLPVIALNPEVNEKVLDMASAPGGKTTHIAQLMKNTGVLVANDVNRSRVQAVAANLSRCGAVNAVICCLDGRQLPTIYTSMDKVLLDAPCSGTGVISRDPSAKSSKNENDLKNLQRLQKELLLAAIDCCRVGGHVVYSTCSVLLEENECVVHYATKRRFVEIVETGLPFGKEGFSGFKQYRFDKTMSRCRRYYPHSHNLDGFFVCRLYKTKPGHISKDKKVSQKPTLSNVTKQITNSSKRKKVKAAERKRNAQDRAQRLQAKGKSVNPKLNKKISNKNPVNGT